MKLFLAWIFVTIDDKERLKDRLGREKVMREERERAVGKNKKEDEHGQLQDFIYVLSHFQHTMSYLFYYSFCKLFKKYILIFIKLFYSLYFKKICELKILIT